MHRGTDKTDAPTVTNFGGNLLQENDIWQKLLNDITYTLGSNISLKSHHFKDKCIFCQKLADECTYPGGKKFR